MAVRSSESDRINLSVLQRIDPGIVEIIDSASEVNHFNYNVDLGTWEDSGFEGSLFIYKRSHVPCHGFVIMNRLNMTNLVEPFINMLGFDLKEPYLLYENNSCHISCIWFYERQEYTSVTDHFQRIVSTYDQPPGLKKKLLQVESSYNSTNAKDVKDIPIHMIYNVAGNCDKSHNGLKNASSQVIPKNHSQTFINSSIHFDTRLPSDKQHRVLPLHQESSFELANGQNGQGLNESNHRRDPGESSNMKPVCQALMHLLNSEPQVVTRVHEAYIASLQSHMKRLKL